MKNDPRDTAEWLRLTRKRLHLSQSDVSAILTVELRGTWNQGRLSEFENGHTVIPYHVLQVLVRYFNDVERLHSEGRHWTDVFPH